MTFVYDQLTIFADDVVNDAFLAQALNHRNVNLHGRLMLAASNPAGLFWRKAEKLAQRLNPLVEQLAAMNHDQRVHFASSNQGGHYNSFAEGGRSGQNACLVL